MSQSNAPLHDIRVGQGIKATIWANENDKGVWHNVTISRTYQDGNGKLRDSNSFTKEQLPFVEKAAEEAFRFLQDQASHGETRQPSAAK